MTRSDSSCHFRHSMIALAVFAALGAAHAQSTDEKAKPAEAAEPPAKSRVPRRRSAWVWGLSAAAAGSRSIYNQYNALGLNNDNSPSGILGFDYSVRDPDASTLFKFSGSNLLDQSRELGLSWSEPGEWRSRPRMGNWFTPTPTRSTPAWWARAPRRRRSCICQAVPAPATTPSCRPSVRPWAWDSTSGFRNALQFEVDLKTENKDGSKSFWHWHELPVGVCAGMCQGPPASGRLGDADGAPAGQFEPRVRSMRA